VAEGVGAAVARTGAGATMLMLVRRAEEIGAADGDDCDAVRLWPSPKVAAVWGARGEEREAGAATGLCVVRWLPSCGVGLAFPEDTVLVGAPALFRAPIAAIAERMSGDAPSPSATAVGGGATMDSPGRAGNLRWRVPDAAGARAVLLRAPVLVGLLFLDESADAAAGADDALRRLELNPDCCCVLGRRLDVWRESGREETVCWPGWGCWEDWVSDRAS
jgi:hypothetical protein